MPDHPSDEELAAIVPPIDHVTGIRPRAAAVLRRYRVARDPRGREARPRWTDWYARGRSGGDWYRTLPVGSLLAEESRDAWGDWSHQAAPSVGVFGTFRVLDGPLTGERVVILLQDELGSSPPYASDLPVWLEIVADGSRRLTPFTVQDMLASSGRAWSALDEILAAWQAHVRAAPKDAWGGHFCSEPCWPDLVARVGAATSTPTRR